MFAEEESAEFAFDEPLVDGPRAAVQYRAVIRAAGGEHTLVGMTFLRFRDDGLCAEHRDYWALVEGRVAVDEKFAFRDEVGTDT